MSYHFIIFFYFLFYFFLTDLDYTDCDIKRKKNDEIGNFNFCLAKIKEK